MLRSCAAEASAALPWPDHPVNSRGVAPFTKCAECADSPPAPDRFTGSRGGGNGVDGRAALDNRDVRRVRSGRTHPGPDRGQDPAGRPVVALPARDVRGVLRVRGLRDLAGLPGRQLLRRALPLAVLLTLPDR